MITPKDEVVLAEERARELRPLPFRTERQRREAMARVEPRCPACLGELEPRMNQGAVIGFDCLDPSCRRSWSADKVLRRGREGP